MPEILTDLEKEAVASFLANTTMAEAVRKVLLAGIYYNGTLVPGMPADPTLNFVLQYGFLVEMQNVPVSDAELGADVRAEVKAIRKVEQAFKQLKNYVPTPPVSAPAAKPNKGK